MDQTGGSIQFPRLDGGQFWMLQKTKPCSEQILFFKGKHMIWQGVALSHSASLLQEQ